MPDAEAAGADDGPFPELLAGMVAANAKARGDDRAIPSNGAPRGDTPAGIETMPGLTVPAAHEENAALVAGATAPAGKRSAAGRLATGHAGSRERSAAASKLRMPGANGPEPDTGKGHTISEVQIQPLLPNAGAERNLPAWTESGALAGGNGEATRTGAVLFPGGDGEPASLRQAARRPSQPEADFPIAAGKAGGEDVALPRQPSDPPPASQRTTGQGTQAETGLAPVAAETGSAPAVLAIEESATWQHGGWGAASQGKATAAATVMRTGVVLLDGQKEGLIGKAPALARKPGRLEAKADARPAGGATASLQVAGLELTQPAPAQPPVPPPALDMSTRIPRAAAPGGETTGRALVPEPLDSPPDGRAPTDFSGRRPERAQDSAPLSRRPAGSVVAQVLALNGQVARTADSISSEERGAAPPAKVAPEGLAGSLGAAEDTKVRVLAASTPDRDEVAFAVRIKATPTPADGAQPESPLKPATAEGAPRFAAPATQPDPAAIDPAAAASGKRASLTGGPDPAAARATRDRRLEAATAERAETPAVASAGKAIPHAEPAAQARGEAAPERPDSTAAEPVRPQDAMESETRPDAAKTAAVHDMKFEVTGGEQRVEVRLSERAGEVKMTVRTGDAPLASSLRENLPALSARLAESGFKSEAWRPAASSANEWRHDARSAAGGASQDANAQPRGQDRQPQDGAGQRRPKSPQEPMPLKEKGRDFAWLMSSLR